MEGWTRIEGATDRDASQGEDMQLELLQREGGVNGTVGTIPI